MVKQFSHHIQFLKDLLGPFHVENEMIVAKAGHTSDGSGSILTPVEADESKALKCEGKQKKTKPTLNLRRT